MKSGPERTLSKLARFSRNFGHWPNAVELAPYAGLGSKWTCQRDLRALVNGGLVVFVDAGNRSEWRVTADGFAHLGLPIAPPHLPPKRKPLTKKAKKERKLRRQADVVAVLDAPLEAQD